jgi:hypothetical protein
VRFEQVLRRPIETARRVPELTHDDRGLRHNFLSKPFCSEPDGKKVGDWPGEAKWGGGFSLYVWTEMVAVCGWQSLEYCSVVSGVSVAPKFLRLKKLDGLI